MKILRAKAEHIIYAKDISQCIDESAKTRGTGIARRTPEYIAGKIQNGNAVIAIENNPSLVPDKGNIFLSSK